MGQETIVVKLSASEQAALRQRLNAENFDWRKVPYASFSVRGEGVIATQYRSGKLVVQGSEPRLFVERFVGGKQPQASKKSRPRVDEASDAVAQLTVTTVGSDEAGKGDYFGPLVVAAVRLEPEVAQKMAAGGVMDSKRLTDSKAHQMGAALRASVPHAIVRVDPEDYNRRYPNYSGLNPFLAELHAEAIAQVAEPGVRVLVDRFANERLMQKALRGLDITLEQATRAERNMAVAAASILARQEFLLGLAELSETFGVSLHKGAGRPTDESGLRFVAEHGLDSLAKVAKLHFKNTGKIRARVG